MSQFPPEEILHYVREHRQEMLAFLQHLVQIETPSTVPHTHKALFSLLADAFGQFDYHVHHIPGRNTGGHLWARPRRRVRGAPLQLVLGHADTVWPVGTLKEMPIEIGEGTLCGPGVYDMKAGLVQMIYALRALHDLRIHPVVTPMVFINSDEEIGSGESTPYIRRLARIADRAFVCEPSLGPEGKLKTARKGVGRFTVIVKGKAAHAGLDPGAGASAILELSYVIQKLFALNDPQRGITVNVGMIDGGLRPNVVAPESRAIVDVRMLTTEDAQAIEAQIRALQPELPGVTLAMSGQISRPPMEQTPGNRALWKVAQQLGREIALELADGVAGGASDGNTTSQWTATLDGLGAVGDGAHARHEFIYVDKLIERGALLALLLLVPPLGAQDERR